MLTSLEATLMPDLDHEIILVDDGSTDGTRDWLRTLSQRPRFRVLLNERNLGFAGANNRAAATASGELLVLLNNDLILTPSWLEPMLRAHHLLPHDGIVGNVQRAVATGHIDHAGIYIDHRGKPEHIRRLPYFSSAVRTIPAVTAACMLTSRDLWNRLGGLDEKFINGCEDLDFCFRARAVGASVVVAYHSIVGHHVSAARDRTIHDEANSMRLTRLWCDLLSKDGSRAWCRHQLSHKIGHVYEVTEALDWLAIGAYAIGLTRHPPAVAMRGMAAALQTEFARWKTLLPADSFE